MAYILRFEPAVSCTIVPLAIDTAVTFIYGWVEELTSTAW